MRRQNNGYCKFQANGFQSVLFAEKKKCLIIRVAARRPGKSCSSNDEWYRRRLRDR